MRTILIRLGAPEGRSAKFYHDFALSLPFGFAALIGIVLAFDRTFNRVFWSCAVVAATTLALASNRRGLIVGLLFCAALRFGIAFALTARVPMLAGALVCALAGYFIAAGDRSNSSDY